MKNRLLIISFWTFCVVDFFVVGIYFFFGNSVISVKCAIYFSILMMNIVMFQMNVYRYYYNLNMLLKGGCELKYEKKNSTLRNFVLVFSFIMCIVFFILIFKF